MSSKDWIGYPNLIAGANRYIMREALRHVAKGGTMGNHHFYITFETHAPGVVLSDVVRAQHPELMTIVLQNKFWDLKVHDDAFEVGLSFNKMPENIRVPFDAIRQFADPSQNMGLQPPAADGKAPRPRAQAPEPKVEAPAPQGPDTSTDENEPAEKPAGQPTVVSLDKFRKK